VKYEDDHRRAQSPIRRAYCAAQFIELSSLMFKTNNKQFLFSAFTSPLLFLSTG
jgi:hypothetical protein